MVYGILFGGTHPATECYCNNKYIMNVDMRYSSSKETYKKDISVKNWIQNGCLCSKSTQTILAYDSHNAYFLIQAWEGSENMESTYDKYKKTIYTLLKLLSLSFTY